MWKCQTRRSLAYNSVLVNIGPSHKMVAQRSAGFVAAPMDSSGYSYHPVLLSTSWGAVNRKNLFTMATVQPLPMYHLFLRTEWYHLPMEIAGVLSDS